MTSRSVRTYVEVDLDEFSDDEIFEEAESRGFVPDNFAEDVTEMFYAFHLGKTDRAIELARKIAQDQTGRTLV